MGKTFRQAAARASRAETHATRGQQGFRNAAFGNARRTDSQAQAQLKWYQRSFAQRQAEEPPPETGWSQRGFSPRLFGGRGR